MKDRVLFKSKEYGHNGHNYCELRAMSDGDIRLWVHDGGTNSLVCLDREDLLQLGEQITKHGSSTHETHETVDIAKRNLSEVVTKTKPRKPRSDKGVKRAKAKKPVTSSSLDMDSIKAAKMQEALSE